MSDVTENGGAKPGGEERGPGGSGKKRRRRRGRGGKGGGGDGQQPPQQGQAGGGQPQPQQARESRPPQQQPKQQGKDGRQGKDRGGKDRGGKERSGKDRDGRRGKDQNRPKKERKSTITKDLSQPTELALRDTKPMPEFRHEERRYGMTMYDNFAQAKADIEKLRELEKQYDQLNIVIRAEGNMDDADLTAIGRVKIFAGAAWALIHERRKADGWYEAPR